MLWLAPASCRSEFVLFAHALNVIVVAHGPDGDIDAKGMLTEINAVKQCE
jgi:hypothetical protein